MAEEATETTTESPAIGDPVPAEATEPVTPIESAEPSPTLQHWSRGEGMGFDDDTIGWLENKNFENPQAAITSQRELEKKMGGPPEMLQKWPESDDMEGFKAIYRRLGTPENVDGYKLEPKEGDVVDDDTLKWFKERAFERNMPNEMAQGIMLDFNIEAGRMQAEQQQALEVQNKIEDTELRIKWGTKFDERLDYGHRGLLSLGLNEEHIESMQTALGPKMLAELAAKIADTMGEDTIAANTESAAFGTTKEQIQNSINELTNELKSDKKRFDEYYEDHKLPKKATRKDYRKMQQLEGQLRDLIKAESG